MSDIKKVAILINGGDAPGLNAVIRAITKSARENGIECYGFIEGYKGLLENNYIRLDGGSKGSKDLEGLWIQNAGCASEFLLFCPALSIIY